MNKEIYRRIKEFIAEHELVEKDDRVLLSMSAGKDSVFLFHLFLLLRNEIPLEFEVFHLNHKTRGVESDIDETFIENLAGSYSVPFHRGEYDFSSSKKSGISFEDEARSVRYARLKEIAARQGCGKISTGHNRDDNIETLIMRLFSGTGLVGLKGISPVRGDIIRPLLCLGASEIVSALNDISAEWREDGSNLDRRFLRNFVRHDIVPAALGRFPSLFESLENLSMIAGRSVEIIDRFIDLRYGVEPEFDKGRGIYSFECEKSGSDRAVFDHLVAGGFRAIGEYPSVKILNEIWRRMSSLKSNILLYENSGISVERRIINKHKTVVIRGSSIAPCGEWSYKIDPGSGTGTLHIKEIGLDIHYRLADPGFFYENRDNIDRVFIDPGQVDGFIIRNRREGDRIALNFGSKKIKKIMIDAKMDELTKSRVPVIDSGIEIAAYMPSFVNAGVNRVAASYSVNALSKKVLAIYTDKKFDSM